MTLIEWIQAEMASDDHPQQSDKLRCVYEGSTADVRAAIDAAFICLCGWSLKVAIENSREQ